MTSTSPSTITLTTYLLKPLVKTPDAALRPSVANAAGRDVIPGVGTLYTQDSHPHPPKWASFFAGAISARKKLLNSSAAGVLLVERKKRLIAVTFGHGKALLEPGVWEEGFGLRVTLNSIDHTRIKSMDHKTFEAVTRHTRTQTSREGTTSDFGLDIERDLVRAVTGEPRDARLGRRLTGMDALVLTAKVDLKGLPDLLERYLERYAANDYKAHFAWIDNIGEVRDPALTKALDDDLVSRLRVGKLDRLWLSVPDIVEWSGIGGFKFRRREPEPHPDMHMRDFLATVDDPTSITLEFLRARRVLVMNVDGDEDIDQWPVYRCIYCETDRGSETYLLSGAKWYRIEKNFVAEVNGAIAALVAGTPALPPYAGGDAEEAAYNARVANASGGSLAHMDRKVAHHGGGRSQIELCDLYSGNREFIHVKRYGGSSAPLSHLFSQGVVSAQLWLGDAEFRKKANALLPKSHKVPDSSRKPDPATYPVVFAVVSRSAQPIDRSLPFFSRLALRNAAQQLRLLGYPVALVKIGQT